eukprot:CAMPEP_0185039958 /NCGR_PEP_ID=MMETSP1103-20130426/37448_1 /TAXON_ID=36769 /ORGANISM="Paraphysomonas bandaiensis, Strain Caron Lab Isolate" /LENGTH=624 /DNA_ID=CAMNT_0027579057 /DNA_START=273 /DNA_END=2147 /DNA_ORIENTATION=+
MTRRLVDSGRSVLLLEAGQATQYDIGGRDYFGGPITRFDIPLFWPSISRYPEYHWQGFNQLNVLQVKGLGGCGVHNAMLYVRCLQEDIRRWNMSSEGWSWSTVLQAYKSLENYVPSTVSEQRHGIPDFHGTGGARTLTTSRPVVVDPVSKEFISAAVQAGLKEVVDFNAPGPGARVGVGYYHFNIKDGTRDSAARRFLAPLLHHGAGVDVEEREQEASKTSTRPLLSLELGAEAHKILLQSTGGGSGLKAVGVEYSQGGVMKRAFLKTRENGEVQEALSVIVAAGAILTPKVLMVSGIGPASELKKADIPLKKHAPLVGKKLQDHPAVGLIFKVGPALAAKYPSAYSIGSHWNNYIAAIESSRSGHAVPPLDFGVLGTPGFSAGGFLASPYARSPSEPDIQLTVFPMVSEPHLIKESKEPLQKNTSDTAQGTMVEDHRMLITLSLLHVDGTYEVTLNHSNPHAVPVLSLPPGSTEYLSRRDIMALSWAVKQVRYIAATPPLSNLTLGELTPGRGVEGSELQQWIRDNVVSNSHWVGTVSMGPTHSMGGKKSNSDSSDDTSVLDSRMRVRGVTNLRVADSSVMPSIPNGNVHSTVVMIASRAADMIIADYKAEKDRWKYKSLLRR